MSNLLQDLRFAICAFRAAGLAVGGAASFWATRMLLNLLYEVSPTDPGTYAAVSIVLALFAVAACGIPTLRAVRVDPLVALRSE